ncbi:exopolyphosphatase [Phycicoccus avicenniae]|uniref:Ppx/GppA phosphatase family protein n=1 Tax=Phycicoccus avicenniae TaxID=2828860 RepID=UPI003D29F8A5
MTRRVGAVDCGTNSIRLLVADVGDDGLLTDVDRRTEVVRLGQGIDRTGVIGAEAMERTLAMSREYAARCRELGAEAVRFVATSASRDARNAEEFVAGVREAFGDLDVAPEVVAGDVEARLSFTGATGDLRRRGIDGPYLVVDLGGGSTELVRGTDDVEAGRSVDIGCVRMTERHLAGDPPTDDEVAAERADIADALAEAERVVDLGDLGAVVGLAGSITTVTAHALGLDRYDRDAIHLAEVPLDLHRVACRDLLGMPRVERGALPYMHPGRVDVIGAGALVWHEVLARVALRSPGVRVVTSEHDILDGIALSVAG